MKADLPDRIKEWREDDDQGYDTAIDLLCEAEEALRELAEQRSLRDYFAGQALAGIVANQLWMKGVADIYAATRTTSVNDMYAAQAYELADSMLEARKR